MSKTKRISRRVWLIMIAALFVWTAVIGFQRSLSASDKETYEGLKTFSAVIEKIENNYVDPVEAKDLIEDAIQGMVHSLDPHSSFLPPEDLEELKVGTKGEFGGVGISITLRDGFVTVISPIEGTPAFRAGIKSMDRIIKIDGEKIRDLRKAVEKMRGHRGTKVKVTIIRRNESKPLVFELVRDIIAVKSVKSFVLKPGYGYVWVTNFQDKTAKELTKALKKLETAKVPLKGLVLDLRDNPGGLLPQAIKVSDLFLEKGKILSIEGRLKRHTKTYKAQPNMVKRNYPIVVLINSGSASASEIVAGALQDNRRGLILGTTSFGKGSVQTVENLRGGYGLKLTIARYFTPSGRSIQAKGIEPDIVLRYKVLDPDDKNESHFIMEKDLRNHLEAEKEAKPEIKTTEKKPTSSKPKLDPEKMRFGPLTLEILQRDNQVMRALQILIGYDILSTK